MLWLLLMCFLKHTINQSSDNDDQATHVEAHQAEPDVLKETVVSLQNTVASMQERLARLENCSFCLTPHATGSKTCHATSITNLGDERDVHQVVMSSNHDNASQDTRTSVEALNERAQWTAIGRCAILAAKVYNTQDQFEGGRVIQHNESTEILMVGWIDGDVLEVAFRGTVASVANIQSDIDFRLVKLASTNSGVPDGVLVHKGFQDAYLSIQAKFQAWLLSHAGSRTMRICGHSLGGALAILAGVDAVTRGLSVKIVTFGAPMVGNHAFAEWYSGTQLPEHLRVVNWLDTVPHVPGIIGYTHCGRQQMVSTPLTVMRTLLGAASHLVQISRSVYAGPDAEQGDGVAGQQLYTLAKLWYLLKNANSAVKMAKSDLYPLLNQVAEPHSMSEYKRLVERYALQWPSMERMKSVLRQDIWPLCCHAYSLSTKLTFVFGALSCTATYLYTVYGATIRTLKRLYVLACFLVSCILMMLCYAAAAVVGGVHSTACIISGVVCIVIAFILGCLVRIFFAIAARAWKIFAKLHGAARDMVLRIPAASGCVFSFAAISMSQLMQLAIKLWGHLYPIARLWLPRAMSISLVFIALKWHWYTECHVRHCSSRYVLKVAPPKFCIDSDCTEAECCDEKARCSVDDCRPSHLLKPNLPEMCRGKLCTQVECCDPKPKCHSRVCSTRYTMKNDPPGMCNSTMCTEAECCDERAKCIDADCDVAHVLSPQHPPLCRGSVCTVAECCHKRATCWAGDCKALFVLKINPPLLCNDSICLQSECCDERAICHANVCGPDQVLKSSPPARCSSVVCTARECCNALAETQGNAIGIDLGTTLSLVGFYGVAGDEIVGEIIVNELGHRLTPSVVSLRSDEVLVGTAAQNLRTYDPNTTVYGVKRLLGWSYMDLSNILRELPYYTTPCKSSTTSPLQQVLAALSYFLPICDGDLMKAPFDMAPFEGKVCVAYKQLELPVEMLSAMVLHYLKKSVSTKLGRAVNKAVITVPAYFNDAQKQATLAAARIAGLEVMRLVPEPTAAALSYALRVGNFRAPEMLAVVDFGGGTLDVSILSFREGHFKVQSIAGNSSLGGLDIDAAVAKHLYERVAASLDGNLSKSMQTHVWVQLLRSAEQAKKALSTSTSFTITVDGLLPGGQDFEVTISRAKFERLSNHIFNLILPVVSEALNSATLSTSQIDRVLLVGGSCRIPKVIQLLTEYFGKTPTSILDLDEAVADGAAILAYRLSMGENSNTYQSWLRRLGMSEVPNDTAKERLAVLKLEDVSPHSVGIAAWSGKCSNADFSGSSTEIAKRLIREGGKDGQVRMSLMWNTISDLDLHVETPDGDTIFYGNKFKDKGNGELDVDMNVDEPYSLQPVENIVWIGSAPKGSYHVKVHAYTDRESSGNPFTLELKMNGKIETIQGSVSHLSSSFVVERRHQPYITDTAGGSRSSLLASGCRREMQVMVPRFSPLPFVSDAPAVFTTTTDGQSRVTIDVLEGEATLADDNRLLGTFELTGIENDLAGVPQVGVHFRIDHNGILHVAAKDLKTGSHSDVEIRNLKSAALNEQMTANMAASLDRLLTHEL